MKFPLSEEQYEAVRAAMSAQIIEDKYGLQSICNIYFDSDNNDLIRSSMEKPVYKEKLRLRTYGIPGDNSSAYAEIKKKYKGIVYKRREVLPYAQAFDFLCGKAPAPRRSQQLDEMEYMIKSRALSPKIVLCYDRRAFYGKEDMEFRVSFDSRIRSRRNALDLRAGDGGELLSGQPFCVMEIKAAGAMPLWAVKILSELKIYKQSFSKYGSIYAAEVGNNFIIGEE